MFFNNLRNLLLLPRNSDVMRAYDSCTVRAQSPIPISAWFDRAIVLSSQKPGCWKFRVPSVATKAPATTLEASTLRPSRHTGQPRRCTRSPPGSIPQIPAPGVPLTELGPLQRRESPTLHSSPQPRPRLEPSAPNFQSGGRGSSPLYQVSSFRYRNLLPCRAI